MNERDSFLTTVGKTLVWLAIVTAVFFVTQWLYGVLGLQQETNPTYAWFRGSVIGMIIAKGVWA